MKFYKHLFFLYILILPGYLLAQEVNDNFDIATSSMRFPHHYNECRLQKSLGFSMVKLPFDWVENAIEAPLVNFHMTFGLPVGFSIEGDVTTIFVSNQLTIGPRWNYRHNNFSFNLGYDLAFAFGQMKVAGFDNNVKAWIHYPNLSIGFKIKDVAFTLNGEVVVLAHTSTRAGQNEITHSSNFFDGGTGALYIEQRLWGDHVFILGLKDSYLKFYWPAWPVFSTFNRFYHIPEIYFSWII